MATNSNGVTLVCGVNTVSNKASLVGQTINDVFENTLLAEMLDLNGEESATVKSGPDASPVSIDDNYTFREGDTVNFSRSAGTKG